MNMTLATADWYWENISKEEVREKLQNRPDGTFLVRNAQSLGGEYTLTLIKDGTEKLIRIIAKNGKYGFVDPFEFDNVVDLIEYYRDVSLCNYNKLLDVKLVYPVSRYKETDDEAVGTADLTKLVHRFVEVHRDYMEKTHDFDLKLSSYRKNEGERALKKQAHEAFLEAVVMFENQIELQAKYSTQAEPHERKGLNDTSEVLNKRLEELRKSKAQLEQDLELQRQTILSLERDINYIKPETNNLSKLKEKLQA